MITPKAIPKAIIIIHVHPLFCSVIFFNFKVIIHLENL